MRQMSQVAVLVLALAVPSVLAAGRADHHAGNARKAKHATYKNASKNAPRAADKDIVDTAISTGMFNTLVAAVKAAGLVETLKGAGPFTVFAPTDEAFAKLPAGTVESLLKPENKDKLVKILTYHVVSGSVTAKQVAGLKEATTVQGGKVKINAADGVRINNAKVIKADVMTANGVIHVIDTVLMPR